MAISDGLTTRASALDDWRLSAAALHHLLFQAVHLALYLLWPKKIHGKP
jgi:hypothetical protein